MIKYAFIEKNSITPEMEAAQTKREAVLETSYCTFKDGLVYGILMFDDDTQIEGLELFSEQGARDFISLMAKAESDVDSGEMPKLGLFARVVKATKDAYNYFLGEKT